MHHPHFTSPQAWHGALDDALALAAAQGKHVFIQVGRQSCGGSRALVERTVAKEEIHAYLDAHYVCVAADADAPGQAVTAYIAQMGAAQSGARTPFCIYLAADGRFVHATAGGRPPAVFLSDLIEASRK